MGRHLRAANSVLMDGMRRSAAAKCPAAGDEEEKGALAPAEDAEACPGPGAGDDLASYQPPKRAKIGCTEADTAKPSVAAAAAGAVAGPLPNTAALQALTGAMDKLEALFRWKE
ncbi:uncharacterized protein [Miscanthus floridulus]|uniref:uncharacterized protein isoform X2 n=1 Tax=Miscanthus floridulus TaxID=154761 RepID=UPI003458CED5